MLSRTIPSDASESSGGCVPVAPRLLERAALHALLERVAEAHRPPVLAAQGVADRAPVQLALVLEQVLDQRQLAVEPPLVLVRVRRRRGGAGEWCEAAHRSVLVVVSFVARSKRGACSVPRPSPRPSVYGSASSPGSSISSVVADSGGAMSSRSRPAASTPISACTMPPKIITTAPTT